MLDYSKHRFVLIQILKDVMLDPEMSVALGFKGGTAAMLFYGLPRFSVDLDFDLLQVDKQEYVFEKMNAILEVYGKILDSAEKRFTLVFELSYTGKMSKEQNIKIEINKHGSGSKLQLMHYLGIAMNVMVKEDMAANKLVAMYQRMGRANRDIYDVWYFFQNHWSVNHEIVERKMGFPYRECLEKCIEALEKMSDRGILSGLGELLTAQQKVWVKQKLRTETIFLLKLALQSV